MELSDAMEGEGVEALADSLDVRRLRPRVTGGVGVRHAVPLPQNIEADVMIESDLIERCEPHEGMRVAEHHHRPLPMGVSKEALWHRHPSHIRVAGARRVCGRSRSKGWLKIRGKPRDPRCVRNRSRDLLC